MDDYITVLLEALEDEMYAHLGDDYFLPLRRSGEVLDELSASFTPRQRELFRAYEDAWSDLESAYQDALARQAFLLARAIFR